MVLCQAKQAQSVSAKDTKGLCVLPFTHGILWTFLDCQFLSLRSHKAVQGPSVWGEVKVPEEEAGDKLARVVWGLSQVS